MFTNSDASGSHGIDFALNHLQFRDPSLISSLSYHLPNKLVLNDVVAHRQHTQQHLFKQYVNFYHRTPVHFRIISYPKYPAAASGERSLLILQFEISSK